MVPLLLQAVPHAGESLRMTRKEEVVLCARNTTHTPRMLGKHTPQMIARSTTRMALTNLSNSEIAETAQLILVKKSAFTTLKK